MNIQNGPMFERLSQFYFPPKHSLFAWYNKDISHGSCFKNPFTLKVESHMQSPLASLFGATVSLSFRVDIHLCNFLNQIICQLSDFYKNTQLNSTFWLHHFSVQEMKYLFQQVFLLSIKTVLGLR